jgi:hypothetical protein
MIYRQENSFDQLSFECLLFLENSTRNKEPYLEFGFATKVRQEIISAIKAKIRQNPDRYYPFESYGIEY